MMFLGNVIIVDRIIYLLTKLPPWMISFHFPYEFVKLYKITVGAKHIMETKGLLFSLSKVNDN